MTPPNMAIEAVNNQGPAPKIILVVDDELFQFRKTHVNSAAPDFYATISDVTDPNFQSLWDVAKAIPHLNAASWDDEDAIGYLSSDEAVSSVLLSDKFPQIAEQSLKDLLSSFLSRVAGVEALKAIFNSAFPAPEFELRFIGSERPALEKVIRCEAIFLDLFLEQGDPSPLETLQKYLQTLAKAAGPAMLPPLILMSSHPELEQHKRNFSEKAGISSAGLMVLPKEVLREDEFGVQGLKLAFTQLNRQKGTAHAMRLFIDSWLNALDKARIKMAQTLWNLDASAMQHIHFASVSDSDPYDEHLNELLTRGYLFHVEADKDVASKVEELDNQFRVHLTEGGEINNRLISPLTDVETARDFMSHFTWLGSSTSESFIDNDNEQKAAAKISRALPFGSVLCRDKVSNGSKCLIHITQQCDLNSISREMNVDRTLIFAIADVTELQPSDNPSIQTSELVAKNLRIIQEEKLQEFDLFVNIGDIFAQPVRDFLTKANSENWKVIGRLRSDITNHIVAATTNQMSRPASQKMLRPAINSAKIFFQSTELEGQKVALSDKNSMEKHKPAKIFHLTSDDGKYSFQDNASIEIALWLAYKAKTIGIELDPDKLSLNLRKGWKPSCQLLNNLTVKIKKCDNLGQAYRSIDPIDPGVLQLTVVIE